ncbi:TNF receptor-associated factor 5-like [Montipora capricornis]|uniref:TNF receptor-associated factor 5-like n=1 Tax=Montipora capricornis TaxID=246305 RepID=UPI0035F15277
MTTSTNSSKCPICRTEFNAPTLSVNVALDNITRDLPVTCLSSGCNWRGSYEDAEQHHKDCPKLEIECENEGCQHVFAREHMATHAASCQKRKIHCPDCSKSVTSDSLLAHRTTRCYHAVTQCPLCGKTLPRSHINLHLQRCPNKACECEVPGCGRILKRKDMTVHRQEAAISHFNLQQGEIQRLRRLIHEKDSNTATTLKERNVASFVWTLKNFPDILARQSFRNASITSHLFSFEGERWRGVINPQMDLFLQLVSSVNTITVELRIVVMPESEREQSVLHLGHATLKEGEMWGRSMANINRWVDGDGKLTIKFLIYYLQFN